MNLIRALIDILISPFMLLVFCFRPFKGGRDGD